MRSSVIAPTAAPLTSFSLAAFLISAVGVPLLFITGSTWSELPKLLALVLSSGLLMIATGLFLLDRIPSTEPVQRLLIPLLIVTVAFTVARGLFSTPSPLGMVRILTLSATASLFLFVVSYGNSLGRERLMAMVLGGGMLALLVSLLSGLGLAGTVLVPDPTARAAGTLCNANLLGSFAGALLIPGVIFLAGRKGNPALRLLSAASFALVATVALLLSGTRGSFAGLAASTAITIPLLVRNRAALSGDGLPVRTSILIMLAAIVAGLAFAGGVRDFLSGGTIEARVTIWTGALRMIAHRPILGWGAGAFQNHFPLFRPTDYALHGVTSNTAHAHSEILEIALESGAAGIVAWGAVAILWLSVVLRRGFTDRMTVAAFSGVAFLAVESAGSVALRWTPSAYLMAFFAAIALMGNGTGTPVQKRRILALPAFLTGLALLVPGTVAVWRIIDASRHLFEAKVVYLDRAAAILDLGSTDPDRLEAALLSSEAAVRECLRAIELCPGEPAAWYTLGNAHLQKAAILALESDDADSTGADEFHPSLHAASEEVEEALSAYGTLERIAPFYAEVTLNIVHVHAMLGRFDDAVAAAFLAGGMMRHERSSCEEFINMVAPFCRGPGAWVAVDSWLLDCIGTGRRADGATPGRREGNIETGIRLHIALAVYRSGPDADSLVAGITRYLLATGHPLASSLPRDLASEADIARDGVEALQCYLSADTSGLYERCLGAVDSSGAFAPLQRYVLIRMAADRSDRSAVPAATAYCYTVREFGRVHLGFLPGGADHLTACARLATSGELPPDPALLEAASCGAAAIDLQVYDALQLAARSYANPVDRAVMEGVMSTWTSVGGPMACSATGYAEGPWLPGGQIDSISILIENATLARPADTDLALVRLGHYARLSYCWTCCAGGIIPGELADRLAESRRSLSTILGEEEALLAVDGYMPGLVSSLVGMPVEAPTGEGLMAIIERTLRD